MKRLTCIHIDRLTIDHDVVHIQKLSFLFLSSHDRLHISIRLLRLFLLTPIRWRIKRDIDHSDLS